MYIRPVIRKHREYDEDLSLPVTGRTAEIIERMKRGTNFVTHETRAKWTPPINHECYAKAKGLGEDFLNICEEYYKSSDQTVKCPAERVSPVIDPEPIFKIMEKYSKKGYPTENGTPQPTRPPTEKMIIAWECAGYSKECIDGAVKRLNFAESQMEIQQEKLNEIFGNYPSINKPTPKKKIIKAVVKK